MIMKLNKVQNFKKYYLRFKNKVAIIIKSMSTKILVFAAAIAVAGLIIFGMDGQYKPVNHFEAFKTEHNRVYETVEEEQYRRSVFFMNLAKIEAHNADASQTYTLGVTQFADLTQEEFVSAYLTTKVNMKFTDESNARTMKPAENLGDVDWVAQGKVTAVKNQGQCGSSWAFGVVGSVQSAIAISKGQLNDLSIQQLLDCSQSYGNYGCNGGWMNASYNYIRDHGLSLESEYPYTGIVQKCKKDSGSAKITGYVDTPSCSQLENALSITPASSAADASNWGLYISGILTKCGNNPNHGIFVVGSTTQFWKIKNSWGPNWGESGYIRIAKGNTCGVCNYASYPTV